MIFYGLHRPKTDLSEGPWIECYSTNGTGDFLVNPCPVCGRGGKFPWAKPLVAELVLVGKSNGWPDIGIDDILLSGRAKEALEPLAWPEGTEFESVQIGKAKPALAALISKPTDFWYCVVPRTNTAIDEKKSGIVWNGEFEYRVCCGGGPKRMKSLVIDESTWSGEDIFQLRNLVQLVVTQRFRERFEAAGLTGAVFRAGEENAFDHYHGFNNPETDVFP
jgi:hypothetical protein